MRSLSWAHTFSALTRASKNVSLFSFRASTYGIVTGLVLLSLAVQGANGSEPKRIFIIHSFGRATPPYTTLSTAFETTLTKELGERLDIDEESLDMARFADVDLQEQSVEFLHHRLAKWQPDLVVPIGAPAAQFVAQFRQRLFPKTPVLYAGPDQRLLPPDALKTNAAYVGEVFDIAQSGEDMLQLAPDTTNFVVITGASPLEEYWTEACRRGFAPFTNRVSLTFLNRLSFDQMLQRVATLPPRSFIFLGLLVRDASGVTLNEDAALQRLHAVANAPINGVFRHQLGLGIVGGHLYDVEALGTESARVAIRILHGEPAASFPPRVVPPGPPRYDWRELHRWYISGNRLPPGHIIEFQQPALWQRYWRWIIGLSLITILEALLIIGLVVNLVDRLRIQKSLRESEERLALATDSAGTGLWSMELDTFKAWVTPRTRELLEFPPDEEVTYDSFLAKIHAEDREKVRQAMQWALQLGEYLRVEYRVVLSNGNVRWIVARGRPQFSASGEPARLMGTATDVTERKRAEEALRDNEQRLSSIYNTVEDIIFQLEVEAEGQYRFVSINQSFCRATGLSQKDVVGKPVAEVIRGPSLTMVLGKYRQAIETKTVVHWEEVTDYPAGQLTGEVSVTPLFDDKGRCTHLIGSVHDITQRKRAGNALRESEERLTLATDSAGAGLWNVELDTQRIWFSSKMREMFHIAPDQEITYETVFQAIHPADREQVVRVVRQVLEQGKGIAVEFRIVQPDGGITWVSNRGLPHYDASGRPERLTGASADVTERKRAEEALQESQEQFQRVVENMHDALIVEDRDGRIVFANGRFLRLFGVTREQLPTLLIEDHIAPEHRLLLRNRRARLLSGKSVPMHAEYAGLRPDGSPLWLEVESVTLKDAKGGITGTQSSISDITDRRLSEERLKLDAAVLDNMRDGVVLVRTSDQIIVSTNSEFDRLLGYKPGELIGKHVDMINVIEEGQDSSAFIKTIRQGLRKAGRWNGQIPNRRKDGSIIWCQLSITSFQHPVHGEVGISMHTDITEQRQNEDEMRRLRLQSWHADRVARTGAITSSLAHELNQPLSAVLSNAQAALRFLAKENPDLDEIREILADIVHADKRAGSVISGLRSMLRRTETPRDMISLKEAIGETLDLLHSELLGKQVEAKMDCESDCFVLADKAQIQQVILNLMMNSVEAMQDQPVPRRLLEVALTRPETDTAQIEVRDSGPGVPDEQSGKLFEPFWTTKSQGMGIGLPLCRSIVESHGGRIWFANNGYGGATFCFTLPVKTALVLGRRRARRKPTAAAKETHDQD